MKIDFLIGELLLRNNCVVVPKFGGFIATQTAATIDFSSGKMFAPKKSILFNKQLTNNDGLLISNYALKNNCSYDQANSEIETQVNSWFEILNGGKRITVEKVGFIYLDNEKNIRFEQDRFFNLLLQSFGMSQVDFVPELKLEEKSAVVISEKIDVLSENKIPETPIIELIPEIKINKKEPKKVDNVVSLIPNNKGNKKLIKYIAAACILPIAFYSVWIPTKTDILESGMLSFQDFNPFKKRVASSYQKTSFKTQFSKIPNPKSLNELTKNLPSDVSIFPLEFENVDSGEENDIFYVKLKNTQKYQQDINEEIIDKKLESQKFESNTTVVQKSSSLGKFKVVVGSFSNEGNANSLMNELKSKGFSASTFPETNGLIRVIAGTSNSNSEANEIISKLNEFQISSWILK